MKTHKTPRLLAFLTLAFASITSVAYSDTTTLFNITYIASGAPARVWLDDDGDYWNYIPTWTTWPSPPPYLAKTSENTDSGIGFQTTQRFAYFFNNGPAESDLGYPDLVAQNGVYISTVPISGISYTTAQILLTGLNPTLEYNFTFYASSRTGTAANAGLLIKFNGGNDTTLLVAGSGKEAKISINGISANPSGQLYLDFSLADTYTYGYLNSFSVTAVPEPSVLGLLALAISAHLFRRGRNRRKN